MCYALHALTFSVTYTYTDTYLQDKSLLHTFHHVIHPETSSCRFSQLEVARAISCIAIVFSQKFINVEL